MVSSIRVFSEGIDKQQLRIRKIIRLVRNVILHEGCEVGSVNVIFCDDQYLGAINKKFLKHNTLTDVITFDYREDFGKTSGDIFISYERVRENALSFQVKTDLEVYRVVAHGVLHLLGYDDRTKGDSLVMRQKEEYYLKLVC